MMLTVLGVQLALLATMATCRKRAAVIKALTVQSRESAPVRMLSRALSARVQSTTLERLVAAKAATLIRGFVQTTAFDKLIISAVKHLRARVKKESYSDIYPYHQGIILGRHRSLAHALAWAIQDR
jgi:hypothetical protein